MVTDYPTLLLRGLGNNQFMFFPDRTFDAQNAIVGHYVFRDSVYELGGLASSSWYLWQGETVGGLVLHELRAPAGQSFTLVDLKAESDDATVPVSFIGLSEGQVIQGGTPVQFKLGVTRFADRTDASATYPKARWSFRVKEKPGFVYQAEATLAGKWTELARP